MLPTEYAYVSRSLHSILCLIMTVISGFSDAAAVEYVLTVAHRMKFILSIFLSWFLIWIWWAIGRENNNLFLSLPSRKDSDNSDQLLNTDQELIFE